MFYLLYFLKYYKKYIKKIFLGIILSIINNLLYIILSIISGYLLTSTFLLSINKNNFIYYNYIIPSIIIRIISIIKIITKYFEKIIQHNTTLYLLKSVRILILKKIFPLYPSNLTIFQNIEILNMLVSDIETLDFLYIQIISPIFSVFITILIIFINFIFLNFFFSLMSLSIFIILILLYSVYFYKKGKIIGEKNIKIKKKYYFTISNLLSYRIEHRLFNNIKYIFKKIDLLEFKWQKIQFIQNKYNTQSQVLIIFIINISILLFIIYSHIYSYNINIKHKIILFLLFLTSLSNILLPISNIFQNISEIFLSAKNIFNIIEQKPLINFTNKNKYKKKKILTIDIVNLSFRYNNKSPYVLKNISLNIKQKQKIIITGHNGSGKSTLLMLLTRAWDPFKGNIYYNKYNLKNWDLFLLRNNISVISQRVYLLSDTLKNNILLNNQNNKHINDNYLIKILKLVGLEKLLDNKKGLDLWMGDGGKIISGGELKKLGIARTIIHNGNLILLDEPTEGLDVLASNQIMNLIFSIFYNKTIIFITHNINILKKADCIYFIENGYLIKKGKFSNLIKKKNYYWNFIKNNIV
ncbi:ATP-binding cassette domain-containing protein [Enterobacteriaceae endosymbiont of Donacia versicolorea]|uniref:ATP-binding cassette domain-containing protein n=1 Tax=Enterobacteriaceae endosymbiont of Donacia versicolorea TaxID=2675788 RepID=UPI00144931FC|nr:ATP-binding cassette domain-containing protein [Enterobacteriaceae endosymbiont of Donacia versicolorea]QJC32276.1 ATP-binding cassette domain-containing protein [Enterobacteriaceae endosymbiont of Donacia versicolorea]